MLQRDGVTQGFELARCDADWNARAAEDGAGTRAVAFRPADVDLEEPLRPRHPVTKNGEPPLVRRQSDHHEVCIEAVEKVRRSGSY